jgi:hypothetical protein
MTLYEPDNSAQRVGRHRLHHKGIHSECLYETCPERRKAEDAIREQLILRPDEPVDAPDYPDLEADAVTRLQAKVWARQSNL